MGEARRIGEYQLEDIIGKGAAGSVYRGINLRTGGVVAIKQIRKEGFSSYDEIEAARKEIDMLRDLHHPNIVKYIGYEQTDDELDIILEYCEGGSLQNILRKFNKFPENLVGVYVAQILDGLSYLHSNAILHRDIKPGNILLLKEGVVKLADFGVARVQNGMDTVVGSPYWIAPEVLQLKGATTASDIWSLGCTIVQMVDGKAPYQDLQPMAAMFRIGQDEHPPFPHNISVLLRDFLSKCLVHVPSARATADELRNHEWIRICLREQQREQQRDGQAQRNYERDIRAITQWNQVLQNSSPRDVKRFSINNSSSSNYYYSSNSNNGNSNNNGGPGYSQHPSSSYSNGNANVFGSYNALNNSSGNLNNSYGSARTRDDITGAISGVSSMGISNSNDSATRRTVSSIAAYEEDSGDDWENAFENLDALQLKPKPRPGILYPQSIGIPMSPAVGPRKHSLSIASDAPESEHTHFMAAPAERAVSDPANSHSTAALQPRPHTSPPSPRMTALKNASSALPPVDYMPPEYEDGRNSTSSNENGLVETLEYIDGGRVSGSTMYYASASDVRLDAVNEVSSKRPSLGLRQDYANSASAPFVQASSSMSHQRDTSQISVETPNASSDHLPMLLYQQLQQQGQQQGQQNVQRHQHTQQQQQQQLSGQYAKQRPPYSRHRVQESKDIIPPGFPSKASEERLRRETEIRWVQDIGSIINQLRECTKEDTTIRYCQQVVVLLREGRGVFSACQDWRVRSIVDAIRIHQGSSSATKHLIVLVNRLCHMDSRYSRTFCLHGVLPLILPILYRQASLQTQQQSQTQAQGQQAWAFSAELQAECIGFISRICRAEDSSPIQMLLAADGISALCKAIDSLVDLDVSVAATQLSRVVTSLISLIITKSMPSEISSADMGDMLAQAHIISLLDRVFAKYGDACQLPSSGQSSANGSDNGHTSQPTSADRVYHGVCDVLMVVSRLLNELIRRVDSLQDSICDSDILASIFQYLYRYPRKAVVLVIHGVRFLSKNPMSLDVLDRAGIFPVSVTLLRSPSSLAYREYVMTTVLRLCGSSLERQNTMASQYPYLVSAAMEYAQLKEAPTLSKCGRLIILGLANGGAQCCRVLKEVNAFELVVKLISRERWCGLAIRALLDWTREVPSDIVPSLTNDHSAVGWGELARPLLTLSTSSTTLDIYAATFYSLVRLYVPEFPRACMGTGEATDECLWITLMDRYLKCSRLGNREPPKPQTTNENATANSNLSANAGGAGARPEVVAANHMNATTRLTFLNLLLLLQPHLRVTNNDMRRRIGHYYTEMVISSKLDAALPVRKASLELSLALGRM